MIEIEVRWHDGYLERFPNVVQWRCGNATLWMNHASGKQEWIPLMSVRRFTFSEECPNVKWTGKKEEE